MTMTAATHPIIDIGLNLTHRSFAGDRQAVLARGAAAGVVGMVLTGTSVHGSEAAVALAHASPAVLRATVGIHPHDATHAAPEAIARLAELTRDPLVVAVGECGLDFDRNYSPPAEQERAFVAQLELAAATGLPVFLHERAAHERFVAILREHRARLAGAVVHCFTGTAAELDAYLALDLHIGITGWICDERRGHHLRDLMARIPASRLMLETDAPFLTPRDLRPKPAAGRNEPAFLPHILAAVARAAGRPAEELALATTATARAFFRWPAG